MEKYLKHINLVILTVALPCVYGCGAGDGGIGALTSFLFGGIGSGFTDGIGSFLPLGIAAATGGGSSAIGGGAVELAALHNPEPASMLLVGSGMMAMTYFRSRKNRSSKG